MYQTAVEENRARVPMFTGENYHEWWITVTAACLHFGCWEAVIGFTGEPQNEKERKRREELDRRARGILLASVDKAFLGDIGECESAKEISDKLKELHSVYGGAEVTGFFRELALCAESAQEYTGKIAVYCEKMKKCGVTVKVDMQAGCLIISLPKPKYEHFMRTLQHDLQSQEPAVEEVKETPLSGDFFDKTTNFSQHEALKAQENASGEGTVQGGIIDSAAEEAKSPVDVAVNAEQGELTGLGDVTANAAEESDAPVDVIVPREAYVEDVIRRVPSEKPANAVVVADLLAGDGKTGPHNRSLRERAPAELRCRKASTSPADGGAVQKNEEDALQFPRNWRQAMEEEIRKMKELGTFELIERPVCQNVLGSEWVLNVKDGVGQEPRFEARLVAQANNPVLGIHFNEFFSPAASKKTLRLLLAIAVQKDWEIEQYDVLGAFLNSPLEETVFMEQAPGIEEEGYSRDHYVYKLNKSVYGLKQYGRNWYCYLKKCLEECGLKQSVSDPCVFVGENAIFAFYVDDFLGIGLKSALSEFKENIGKLMELKDLGSASKSTSVSIIRDVRDVVMISHTDYIKSVLENFEISECQSVVTPSVQTTVIPPKADEMSPKKVEISAKGDEISDKDERFSKTLYMSAIGALNCIANCTRPDIFNAVCKVSQSIENPSLEEWCRVKRILRYLRGTVDYVLRYFKEDKTVKVYCDADWANENDAKSYSGYAIVMCGGAVIWRSKKQDTVATSTTHAEYLAMYEVAKEVVWLQDFFEEIGVADMLPIPTEIYADNQGAIALAMGNCTSDRSKHFRAKLKYVQECVKQERMCFKYVRSEENLADLFTKKLSGLRVEKLSGLLGLK